VRPHFGYLTEVVDSEPVLWPLAQRDLWIPRTPVPGRSIMRRVHGAQSASVVLGRDSLAQESHRRTGRLPKGDAALLRFTAAVELIEADLWQQYNELGDVQGGNPAVEPELLDQVRAHMKALFYGIASTNEW
jgi:hypothetical protein